MSWWIFLKIESSEETNMLRWKMLTLFHCFTVKMMFFYWITWGRKWCDLVWFYFWVRVWERTKIRSWKCCALAPTRNSTKSPTFISLVMIPPKFMKRDFVLTGKQWKEWMFLSLLCSVQNDFDCRPEKGHVGDVFRAAVGSSCCKFSNSSSLLEKGILDWAHVKRDLFSFLTHVGQSGWVQQTQSHPSQVRRGGPRQGPEEMEHGCGSVHRHLCQSQFRPATRNHQRIRKAIRHGHWDRDPERNERRFGEILSHLQ